jgi:hypothetical protein
MELTQWTDRHTREMALGALQIVGPHRAAALYRFALDGPNPINAARGLLSVDRTNAMATEVLVGMLDRIKPAQAVIVALTEASSANAAAMGALLAVRDDRSRPEFDRVAARHALAQIRWRELCLGRGAPPTHL